MAEEERDNLDETRLSHLWGQEGGSGTGRPVDGKPIKGIDREGEAACGGLGIAMMINELNREGEANCIFDKNMLILIKEIEKGEEATVNYGMDAEIVKERYNYEVIKEPGSLDHIQIEYPKNINKKIKTITRRWQKVADNWEKPTQKETDTRWKQQKQSEENKEEEQEKRRQGNKTTRTTQTVNEGEERDRTCNYIRQGIKNKIKTKGWESITRQEWAREQLPNAFNRYMKEREKKSEEEKRRKMKEKGETTALEQL